MYKETYKKAIDFFGHNGQILKTIEELSELQRALSRWSIEKETKVFVKADNVFEEIADVDLMLEQLKLIFDCHDIINTVKQQKIERLEGLLDGK